MRNLKTANWWVVLPLFFTGCNPSLDTPSRSADVQNNGSPALIVTALTPIPVPALVPVPTLVPNPTQVTQKPFALGGTCRVHHVLLQRDSVKIQYGLPQTNINNHFEDRYAALLQFFPNSNKLIGGGCLIGANSPVFEDVLFCPQCRLAEDDWLRQHPPFNPPRS